MLSRLSFGKVAGPAFVSLVAALVAAGFAGCDTTNANCDQFGQNCQVCDGYGCHPADTSGAGGATSSTSETSGTGGSGGSGGSMNPCDPSKAACPCDANNMCGGDKQCINGICIVGCSFTYECPQGDVCANGQCVPGCDATSPCKPGQTCQNGVCVPDPNNPACSDMKPCEVPTQTCVNGTCVTKCATNTDCKAGEVCDAATGSCIPDPSPKPGCGPNQMCTGVGQQCGADGYCHYPCMSVNDCKLIDARFSACDQNICKTDEEVNPECSLQKPCPMGQSCISNKCF